MFAQMYKETEVVSLGCGTSAERSWRETSLNKESRLLPFRFAQAKIVFGDNEAKCSNAMIARLKHPPQDLQKL